MAASPRAGTIAIAALLAGCGTPAPAPGPPLPPPAESAAEPAPDAEPRPSADPREEPGSPWAPVSESEREWIRAVKQRQPASWASHEPDPHVVILHDREVKPERVKAMGRELMTLLNRSLIPRFPPARPIDRVLLFRVCKDEAQFEMYGGAGGTSAYWNATDGEGVTFEDRASRRDSVRRLRAIAVMQYLDVAGAPGTHPWFWFGVSSTLSVETTPGRPRYHPWWTGRAKTLRASRIAISLRDLVRSDDDRFQGKDVADNAAISWLLARHLLYPPGPRESLVPERYYLAHRDAMTAVRPADPVPPPARWKPSEEAIERARGAGLEAAFGDLDDRGWKALEKRVWDSL